MKLKMTDQALARVKPRADRYEIWDTLVSNLLVTVYPSGKKSWSVRRSHGKCIKMKLGEYPALALSEARNKAKNALIAVFEGTYPAYERQRIKKANSKERKTLEINNLLKA